MKLKPVENWKDVLRKAWSAYGMYLLVFSGLLNDYLLPALEGGHMSAGFGTFVSVVAAVTLLLRVMQQLSLLLPEDKQS